MQGYGVGDSKARARQTAATPVATRYHPLAVAVPPLALHTQDALLTDHPYMCPPCPVYVSTPW